MTDNPVPSRTLLGSLISTIEVLNANGIPYAIIGGLALQAWGRLRSTRDIDISVILSGFSIQEFIDLMARSGFIYKEQRKLGEALLIRFLKDNPQDCIETEIDFFPAITDYQRLIVERSIQISAMKAQVQIATPEDLIIKKLASGRPIDLCDAEELAKEQAPNLDWEYLSDWSIRLGLREKIEPLLIHRPQD